MQKFLILVVFPMIQSSPVQDVSWRDYKNLEKMDESPVLLSPFGLPRQQEYRPTRFVRGPDNVIQILTEYPININLGRTPSNAFDKLSTILAQRNREIHGSLDFNFLVEKRDDILRAMSPEILEPHPLPNIKLNRKTLRKKLLDV